MATVLGRFEEHLPPAANDGDDGYRPTDDEPFMNPRQQEYFRAKLNAWKDAIYREAAGTLNQLQSEPLREADLTDRASSETDWSIELRTRDRQRKLISKIDAARRIDEGNMAIAKCWRADPLAVSRPVPPPSGAGAAGATRDQPGQPRIRSGNTGADSGYPFAGCWSTPFGCDPRLRANNGPAVAIPANTLSADDFAGKRSGARDSLLLTAQFRVEGADAGAVRVRNLSSGGLMAEYTAPIGLRTPVEVEVRGVAG